MMAKAGSLGYRPGDPDWVNFGQGQPETGPLPGAPDRVSTIQVSHDGHEYSPVSGVFALRQAVADYYNRHYRRGQASQYTAHNVCITAGGRAALTRIAAAIDSINLGHFLPDYTAYEELLDLFRRLAPIPILLEPKEGYQISLKQLEYEILGRGLGAILLSNPNNPTGRHIRGEELKGWVDIANRLSCTMIFDEFYSSYLWSNQDRLRSSAAQYVRSVNEDPIVIVDGLTKNWRYPGWRIAWIVGPEEIIERVASTGSFLDGGAPHPMQDAAIQLLDDDYADREAAALQSHFIKKRTLLLQGLRDLGLQIDLEPEGTFYVWASLAPFANKYPDAMAFFSESLKEKVITVPGKFFDVNPGGRRSIRPSRFRHHVRFSFGPPIEQIEKGLTRLQSLLR